MSIQTRFVLGFVFSRDFQHVLLIHKNRPSWMAGKLNGIGGRAELHERLGEAMIRECREETGLEIADWTQYGRTANTEVHVSVYWAISDILFRAEPLTDECPNIESVARVVTPGSVLQLVEHVREMVGHVAVYRSVGLGVPWRAWEAPVIASDGSRAA